MQKKDMKRCPSSFIIKELQIKTTVRYHDTPMKMAKPKNLKILTVGVDAEQQGLSHIAGGNKKWFNSFWKFPMKLKSVFSFVSVFTFVNN